MSKRHKFVLLTWIGPEVPALKKAKMSLEKTQVKALVQSFAVEIQSSDLEEMALDSVSNFYTISVLKDLFCKISGL